MEAFLVPIHNGRGQPPFAQGQRAPSVEQPRECWPQLLMNCKAISAIAPKLRNLPVRVSVLLFPAYAGAAQSSGWLQWLHIFPLQPLQSTVLQQFC